MIQTPNGHINAKDLENIKFTNPENLQIMLEDRKNEFQDVSE